MTKVFDKQKVLQELSEQEIAATKKAFSGKVAQDKDVAPDFEAKRKQINDAETAVVYLAAQWPEEFETKLADLLRKIFKKEVFVDFRVDPAIIGGGTVALRGKFWDFSIREKFLENKAEIKQIYAKFL